MANQQPMIDLAAADRTRPGPGPRPRERPRKRRRLAATVVLMCVALLAVCAPRQANAQGTPHFAPDPITMGELIRYMERLGLSVAQQAAAESMHEQYKQRFRELRNGLIEQMADRRVRESAQSIEHAREHWITRRKETDALRRRIASVDRSLFDAIEAILTDEQLAMMPRVRLQHTRSRLVWRDTSIESNRPFTDFLEIVRDARLEASDRAILDDALHQWEVRSTSLIKEMLSTRSDTRMPTFDAREIYLEAMAEIETIADPKQRHAREEHALELYFAELRSMRLKEYDKIRELIALAGRTFKRMHELLSGHAQFRFRHAYYRTAYARDFRRLADPLRWSESTDFDALDQLSEDQQLRIGSEVRPKQQQVLKHVEKLIETADRYRLWELDRQWTNDMSGGDAFFEQRFLAEEAAFDLQQSIWSMLDEVLTAEQMRQLLAARDRRLNVDAEPAVTVAASHEPGDTVIPFTQISRTWLVDSYLCPPLSPVHVDLTIHVLQCDDENGRRVEEAYQTYQVHYVEHVQPLVDRAMALRDLIAQRGEGFNDHPNNTLENTQRRHALRDEVLNASLDADAVFFDGVTRALNNPQSAPLIEQLRQSRLREANTEYNGYQPGRSIGTDTLDLTRLAYRLPLDDAERQVIAPLLTQYDAQITNVFQRRFAAEVELDRHQMLWHFSKPEADPDDPYGWQNVSAEYNDRMEPQRLVIARAYYDAATTNDVFYPQIVDALSVINARRFLDVYVRLVYAELDLDSFSPAEQLARAASLADLTAHQRDQLSDAAGEYYHTYDTIIAELAALTRIIDYDNADNRIGKWLTQYPLNIYDLDIDTQAIYHAKQRRMGLLQFDRNELCARTMRRLERLLSEQQIAAIGGLPPVPGY